MSQGLLTDQIKDAIQSAYRTWLGAREFKPRRGQREMIAQIARTLSQNEPRICAIEAGPDKQLYLPVGAPCNVCLSDDPRFATMLRLEPATGATTIIGHGIRNLSLIHI